MRSVHAEGHVDVGVSPCMCLGHATGHSFRGTKFCREAQKYYPEARGGSVRLLISPIKGIFGHIGRSPGCNVDTTGPMPYRLDYEDCVSSAMPIAGCKALSLELERRVNGRTGLGRGVNFVTLTGLSLARHVALPDHGVGLDGQSCSCLIVGLSSLTLGVGRPSVMFLFDCWPVGRPMPRTVRGCYSHGFSPSSFYFPSSLLHQLHPGHFRVSYLEVGMRLK
ncbi:hypothetical protein DY000_02030793 [Brassica cretica]|uniref:Uncharacterized protein n=1 Tax=Brassica cretica TaxID=69181 RepID=A0ABQ7DHY7_BRACR|nr:hypothetical protein DY000_02030793 [Brassica cretica]